MGIKVRETLFESGRYTTNNTFINPCIINSDKLFNFNTHSYFHPIPTHVQKHLSYCDIGICHIFTTYLIYSSSYTYEKSI